MSRRSLAIIVVAHNVGPFWTIAKMEAFRADFACPRVLAFDDAGRFHYEHDNVKLKNGIFAGRRNFITTARDTPQSLDLET